MEVNLTAVPRGRDLVAVSLGIGGGGRGLSPLCTSHTKTHEGVPQWNGLHLVVCGVNSWALHYRHYRSGASRKWLFTCPIQQNPAVNHDILLCDYGIILLIKLLKQVPWLSILYTAPIWSMIVSKRLSGKPGLSILLFTDFVNTLFLCFLSPACLCMCLP